MANENELAPLSGMLRSLMANPMSCAVIGPISEQEHAMVGAYCMALWLELMMGR